MNYDETKSIKTPQSTVKLTQTAFYSCDNSNSCKSFKYSKLENRAIIISTIQTHKKKRIFIEQLKNSKEHEIENLHNEKQKLLRDKDLELFFERLSKCKDEDNKKNDKSFKEPTQTHSKDRYFDQHKEFLSLHEKRLLNNHKIKEENLSHKINRKMHNTETKLAKADELLEKMKEYRRKTINFNRECRKKKILRSKIKTVFRKENNICKRCSEIQFKKVLKNHSKAVSIKEVQTESQVDKRSLSPDEILVNNFSLDQLRKVKNI